MPLVFDLSAPAELTPSPLLPNSSDALGSPICPLGSTATKLVRTVEIGRETSPVTLNDEAGERPREGGEVDSSFCSNFARKEATPLGEMPADMTEHQAILATAILRTMVEGSDKE